MDKHPDITLRRIPSFLKSELTDRLELGTAPVKVLTTDLNSDRIGEATQAKFAEVKKGFEWGPAYQYRWFQVTGSVPQDWSGGTVYLEAPVGSEVNVFKDSKIIAGLDWAHNRLRLEPGQKDFDYLLFAYAHNPQHRVYGKEPPREPLVEKVGDCRLVLVDSKLQQFAYDVEYCHLLLQAMDKADPSYHILLRAVNDAMNLFRWNEVKTHKPATALVHAALERVQGDMPHTIWPVGHSHLDTAWLWPIHITQQKMAHTTAIQLELMQRFPEFTFAHSQASQYEWLEKAHPDLLKKIKDAVRRGQWDVVGSMWVECDCNVPSGESFVRQFLYGKRYFKEKLGVETDDMWLPDVFGYSAALPQILQKFKINSFLTQKISWNQTNKFPHNTFLWQGIDGSRIWSHFPPADTYIGNCEPGEILNSVKNHKDHGRSDDSLYLYGWGDGGGGVTDRHIEFLRRGRLANNMPVLRKAQKASDFFKAAQENSRDLAVWVGELYLEFHRGTYTSQAKNKLGNRRSEFLLRDAEFLACFAPGFPSTYPAESLEQAWKTVLLNQFHDILPGTSVNEVYVDSARDYEEVRKATEKVIDDSLRAIASRHDTSQLKQPIALFHNATQAGLVEVAWDKPNVPTALELDGEPTPVQLVEEFGERKLIFATPHSALTNVAVGDLTNREVEPNHRLKIGSKRLENESLSVKFDSNGNIASLKFLADGLDVGVPGELLNVFQLFEDKPLFWSAWDIDPYTYESCQELIKSESFEIVEKGPVRAAAEIVKTFGNSRIKQRISLGPTAGIRFDTEVDWHEEDKLLKVAFPLNYNATRATYEIQCGYIERPTHANTSWDGAKFETCAQKWVDVSEGVRGVALINDCKYGHDMRENLLRLSLLRSPKAPDPTCDMGVHRFSYWLMPHFGPFRMAGIVHHALACNTPLRYAMIEPTAGENGVLPYMLSVDTDNLVIQSVKRAESGDGIIVRLYECHNTRGTAAIQCVRPFVGANMCWLDESEGDELDVHKGTVMIDYKPFEIITIKLRV